MQSNTKPKPRVKTPTQTEPLEVRKAIQSRAAATATAALKKRVDDQVAFSRFASWARL